MSSYRDRYDEFLASDATIIAVSADKEATQVDFRSEIGAAFSFVADTDGSLIRLYGVKTPLIKWARRTTFVIGKDRRVRHIDTGMSAIDVDGALAACRID